MRAAVSAGTDVGVKAKGFMERGELVPDGVIIGIVKDRLAESDCIDNGWLLDEKSGTLYQGDFKCGKMTGTGPLAAAACESTAP